MEGAVSVKAEVRESVLVWGNAHTALQMFGMWRGRKEQGGVNPGLCLCKKLGFLPAGNGQELKVFKMRNGRRECMFRNSIC